MNEANRSMYAAYINRHKPDPGWLSNTPAAIKKFQSFHGLTPDGIVGPKTRRVMHKLNTTLGQPPARPHSPSLHRHKRTDPGPTGRGIYNT